MRSAVVIAVLLGLGACATAEDQPTDPLSSHVSALEGRWSNATQWARASDELRRPAAVGHPYEWIDFQAAEFHRVEAPLIGAHVVYLEWRTQDGALSRQRIWSFRRDEIGGVRMDFYTLRAPEMLAGRGQEDGAFAALGPDDLIGYGEACALVVTPEGFDGGFNAEIPPTCRITARSGREMTLSAQVYLEGGALAYQEAGLLDDGSFAFKVPGGPPYIFFRSP
jgi:hypothetical protein